MFGEGEILMRGAGAPLRKLLPCGKINVNYRISREW
jgi:hypothetical protein